MSSSSSSSFSWTTTLAALGIGVVTGVVLVRRNDRRLVQKSLSKTIAKNGKQQQSLSSSSSSNNGSRFYYLDYNGTTPVYPEVLEAMVPYWKEHWGNPSSSHRLGTEPSRAIQSARHDLLTSLLGLKEHKDLDERSIYFTGCGTESDNMAVQLALQSSMKHNYTNSNKMNSSKKKPHIVTSNVEHPAVELYLKYLEEELGVVDITYVPVDNEGCVDASDVLNAITDDTVLVTVMLANNESGSLQPVKEIAVGCRRRGVLMHTDAAQAAGKVSIRLDDIGNPDMISIVGHKIGAPKGIAALYVRPGCLNEEKYGRTLPHNHGILLIGGGQEFGRRGGTENTAYIVGLGRAAVLAQTDLDKNAQHMEKIRSRLLNNLQTKLGGESKVRVNGPPDPSKRLPNTLSIGFEGVHSGKVLSSLSQVVAASAGATCHGTGSVSAVLKAMNVPLSFARGTLRLSLGPKTTVQDVDEASELIAAVVKEQWTATAQ